MGDKRREFERQKRKKGEEQGEETRREEQEDERRGGVGDASGDAGPVEAESYVAKFEEQSEFVSEGVWIRIERRVVEGQGQSEESGSREGICAE